MQIRLSNRGPIMWFLGDPKNLTASLNISNPTAEIDFDKLQENEQKKVLQSVREKQIECDEDYQSLYRRWLKSNTPSPKIKQVSTPTNNRELYEETVRCIEEKKAAAEDRRKKEKERKNQQILNLVKSSTRTIVSALGGEKDIEFLKMLIEAEQVGKARKTVIKFAKERLKKIAIWKEEEQARKINAAVKEQMRDLADKERRETIMNEVVESEYKTVVLTPEDLITAIANDSSGGEK